MATSGITSPISPVSNVVRPTPSNGAGPLPSAQSAQSAQALSPVFTSPLGLPDPVMAPGVPMRPESSRRPTMMQVRPEYAMVALMAQRPGQLKKLFESLGGSAASMDVEAVSSELDAHIAGGGTLAQFGAKLDLDPTTLYLLAVRSRILQRSGRGKVSHGLERDMDDLLAAHEAEVGAALNTSQAMRALAGSASDRMWMRSLYVAAITVRSPISETFESLLQRFGTEGFEQGASTLLRALSDDIAANRSSVPSDRLQGLLLASLVSMRHVLGLIHSSQGFLRRQGLVAVKPSRGDDENSKHDRGEGGSSSKDDSSGSSGGSSDDASGGAAGKGGKDGKSLKVDDAHQRRAEVLTVQLVRLLLQLAATSNATKTVPSFLNQDVGGGSMQNNELIKLRSQFLELIRSLPATLWKEAAHKDHLMEALRRQFEVEAAQRLLPGGPPPLQAPSPPSDAPSRESAPRQPHAGSSAHSSSR